MGKAPVYFSEMITIGPNTYLMEVKRRQRGQKYFLITPTNAYAAEQPRVVVFANYMARFTNLIERAAKAVHSSVPVIEPRERSWAPKLAKRLKGKLTKPPKQATKSLSRTRTWVTSFEDARREYANAHRAWTKEDGVKLTRHLHDETKVTELVRMFERKPGPIRARLKRLDVKILAVRTSFLSQTQKPN